MNEKKTYVLDTNVLLSDPNSIFSFQEHNIVIPMVVLEELDHHKSRPDEVGRNARQVTRSLDKLREQGSLMNGVDLTDGGTLKVGSMQCIANIQMPGLEASKPDNMIIAYAKYHVNSIVVSKDINVRIKCDSFGVPCEDYLKMRVADDPQKFYKGVEVIEVEEQTVDKFFHDNKLTLSNEMVEKYHLYPNQIVIIKTIHNGQTIKSALTKCVDPKTLGPIAKIEQAFGLKPRNKEQTFSLDLLFDDKIKLLTLVGPSGCVVPETPVSIKLEQLSWHMPVPDDTYIHAPHEDEQEDIDT